MTVQYVIPPVTMPPIVYPACLFHALNLAMHRVKHGQSGRVFTPDGYQMQSNRHVANYQDDLGNKYTVTVEAQS